MTKKSLYTVTEAAEVLGLSVSRVRKLCADGRPEYPTKLHYSQTSESGSE